MDFYSITEESENVIKYKRDKLSTDATDPVEKIVYMSAAQGNAVFFDNSDIDINIPEEEEEDSTTATGSSCQTQFNYNMLLWLSSLILALLLIIVLIIVLLKAIKNRLKKNEKTKLSGKYDKNLALENAVHIAWATGGSMVPPEEMRRYYETGKQL